MKPALVLLRHGRSDGTWLILHRLDCQRRTLPYWFDVPLFHRFSPDLQCEGKGCLA